MQKIEKWIQSTIGTLIGAIIVTVFTGCWSSFLFTWLFSIPFTRMLTYFLFERKMSKRRKDKRLDTKPFNIAEYAQRREKFLLEIERKRHSEPKHKIILWLGFDGLKIDKDGTFEWICRKSTENIYMKVNPACGINTSHISTKVVRW